MSQGQSLRDVVYLPLFFNVISFGLIGALFALAPDLMANNTYFTLSTYAIIFVTEWIVAYYVVRHLRGLGMSLCTLLSARKPFRKIPAVGVFTILSALLVAYIWLCLWTGRILPLSGVGPLQVFFLVVMIPLTSGIVEETTFRGYFIEKMLGKGLAENKAVVYSALSFAFIHGFFLIDKLIVTFVFGLIAGLYYVRQRNLPVLIAAHVFVNVVTFAMTLYGI